MAKAIRLMLTGRTLTSVQKSFKTVIRSMEVTDFFSYFLSLSLSRSALRSPFPRPQCRVPGEAQGDPAAFCHEEDQPSEPDAEEPDPAGICGKRHPDLR